MSKKHQQLGQDVYDLAFLHALSNLAEKEDVQAAELLDQFMEAPKVEISKQFRRNMGKLLKNANRQEQPAIPLKKHMLPLVVILIVLLTLTLTANASIADFFDWIFHYNTEYVSMEEIGRMENECAVKVIGKADWKAFYFPQKIPMESELIEVEANKKLARFTFKNENGMVLQFRQMPLDRQASLFEFSGLYDNEGISKGKRMVIEGQTVYWFSKRGQEIISFDNNDFYFELVFSEVSRTDIKKICTSLKKISK